MNPTEPVLCNKAAQVPFHCTASGKMYLSSLRPVTLNSVLSARVLESQTEQTITSPDTLRAELQKTRARGYATDDEELMTGMAAIAVPILDPQGRLMATLSVHAPVQRRALDQILEFLEPLTEAAARLTQLNNEQIENLCRGSLCTCFRTWG